MEHMDRWLLLAGFVPVALVLLISKSPFRGPQIAGAAAMFGAAEICIAYGLFRVPLGIIGTVLVALGFVAVGATAFLLVERWTRKSE